MNNLLKLVLYGIGGAIGGWIVATIATLVLGAIAGILVVIEIRFLIVVLVLLTLATPIIPALAVGGLVSSASTGNALSKKTQGLIAAGVALVTVSIPLALIIRDNFPVEFMKTLEQPDWVGTVMTWYAWLMVVLSPIIAFALASDIPIGLAKTDRGDIPPA